MKTRRFSLASLVLATACGGATPTTPITPGTPAIPGTPGTPAANARYFPPVTGDTWETISPAAAGWDTASLRSALDWAGTQQTNAVVMLWKGRIVAERYWNGWTPSRDSIIASAGKSITSVMIGISQEQGRLRIDATAGSVLGAGWSRSPASEQRITIRHLLSMTSGLDDSLRFVVEPGSRFYYNNPAYYKTFEILTRSAGLSFTPAALNSLSKSLLFDRIGMRSANWRLNFDTGEPGFVLSCTPRDMARFGLLTLAGGTWDGTPVLGDTSFLAAMLRSSSTSNPGYGLLWWLNGQSQYRTPGPYLLPTTPGALIPNAPGDLVAALGKGDKKIYVVPSLDLVVVRQGLEADASGGNPLAISNFDNQWWARLKPALRY